MAASDISPNEDNYYLGKGIVKWKGEGETTFRDIGNVPTYEYTQTVTKLDHFSSRLGTKTKDKSVVTEKAAEVKITMDEITASNLAMALMGEASGAAVDLTTTASTHTNTVIDALASVTGLVVGNKYRVTGTGIPANTTMIYNGANAGTLSQAATATGTLVAVEIIGYPQVELFTETQVEGYLRFIGENDIGAKMQIDLPKVAFNPSGVLSPIGDDWGVLEVTGEVTANLTTGSFGQVYWNTNGVEIP